MKKERNKGTKIRQKIKRERWTGWNDIIQRQAWYFLVKLGVFSVHQIYSISNLNSFLSCLVLSCQARYFLCVSFSDWFLSFTSSPDVSSSNISHYLPKCLVSIRLYWFCYPKKFPSSSSFDNSEGAFLVTDNRVLNLPLGRSLRTLAQYQGYLTLSKRWMAIFFSKI